MAQRPRHTDKAHEQFMRELEAQDWRCEQTRKGHWRCLCPCGEHILTLAGSASDHRAIRNARTLRNRTCWRTP